MQAMKPEAVDQLVELFVGARERRHPVPVPLPQGCRPPSPEEAYRVQAALNGRLARTLGAVCGRKIGCTTPVMQRYLRIEHPCAGALYAGRVHRSPATVAHAGHWRPGVECEIAVRLGRALPADATPFDRADIAASVESCMAAIEIVDDRYDDFRALDAASLIADDFFSAGAVVGAPVAAWRGLDLAALRGTMTINDEAVGAGVGADVMGHPFEALAWLANHAAATGRPLAEGDLVLTGSIVESALGGAGRQRANRSRGPWGSLRFVRALIRNEQPEDPILVLRPGPNPRAGADWAAGMEKLGFDCVWASDHLTEMPPATAVMDSWTMLADIGARTTTARLGNGVIDVQRVHPAKVASMVATLDQLTNGRVNLGIGAGEVMNTRPYGMPWEASAVRIGRLKESLEVMKLLWGSSIDEPVSYSGEHYRLDYAHLALPPVQKPHPPIYVGAFTATKMFHLIGEMGHGWLPGTPNTEASLTRKVAAIRGAAERAGRSMDEIDVIASVPFAVSGRRAVRETARELLKRILVYHTRLLKDLGMEVEVDAARKELEYQYIEPTADQANELRAAVERLHIPEETVDRGIDEMMAVGTLEQCIASFERLVDRGVTNFNPRPLIANEESYEILSRDIMPHFKPNG